MDEKIVKTIIEQYEKGIPPHEIETPIKMRTSEVYRIIRSVKSGEINKDKIIVLFTKKIPLFQIAKKLNIPYDDVMKVINSYRKKTGEYNKGQFGNVTEKIKLNKEFLKYLQPNSILDAYAGEGKTYPKEITVTNDIDKKYPTTLHDSAEDLLKLTIQSNTKFDLVDLDPYGSCHKCWNEAIRVAQKGIVISYGDLMVWRYHYQDNSYWSPILGNGRKPLTIHDLKHCLIQRAIELGWYHSKNLHIWNIFQTWQFMRVYYVIG